MFLFCNFSFTGNINKEKKSQTLPHASRSLFVFIRES